MIDSISALTLVRDTQKEGYRIKANMIKQIKDTCIISEPLKAEIKQMINDKFKTFDSVIRVISNAVASHSERTTKQDLFNAVFSLSYIIEALENEINIRFTESVNDGTELGRVLQ